MFLSLFSLFLILCVAGEFGTVIVHGGDEVQKSFAQSQLQSGKAASTALEHVESTLINGTGRQLAESWYLPPYCFPSSKVVVHDSMCEFLVNVNFIKKIFT